MLALHAHVVYTACMETTEQRSQTWVITEHRQITVECPHPFEKSDAMRIALGDTHPSYVVSDHTRRNSYPINA